MVPEAPIDGTMPSVFPEDRSGDFTFTRGSNLAATRVASNGLIEKGRENLLTYSNDFSQWPTTLMSATGGQAGYDGSNDAWKIESLGGNASVRQTYTGRSGIETYSIYLKAGTTNWVRLNLSGAGNEYFDIANGVVGTGGSLALMPTITSVGGGWYRCTISNIVGSTQTGVYMFTAIADGTLSTSSGDSVYMQDAQLEYSLVATSYIESGAITGKAGLLENEPRIDFTGGGCGSLLLEPQRTNLATNSEYTGAYLKSNITATSNQVVSPEGVENATEVETTSTGQCHMRTAFTAATGNYVGSVFIKKQDFSYIYMELGGAYAWFNINDGTKGNSGFYGSDWTYINHSIEDYGNGWYRCVLVGNCLTAGVYNFRSIQPVSGNGSYNSNLSGGLTYFYGAQVEAGSYPTSYIPTYGSSVTRSGESGVSDVNSLLTSNATYTWMVEFIVPEVGNGGGEITFKNTSGSSQLRIYCNQNNMVGLRVDDNSQNYYIPVSVGDTAKCLFQCTDGLVKGFYNGSLVKTFTIDTGMDAQKIHLGPPVSAPEVKQVLLFNTALTDEECSALTQP